MMMAGNIAKVELTTAERCEFLLGVIACAMTGKKPAELFPWVRSGIDQLFKEVADGA
jgi:hypothetical protein